MEIKNLESRLTESFDNKYAIDSENVEPIRNIYENENFVRIIKANLRNTKTKGFQEVVAKSYKVEKTNLQLTENELVTYKMIENDANENSEFFAKFLGYMLSKDENDPFFFSIIITWYVDGDLGEFSSKLSNKRNWKKDETFITNDVYCYYPDKSERGNKEINFLLELAKQIAKGRLFYIYYHVRS